ncbi:MAG: nucleotidyl transferase AbiEii/AbiGii toxin family protein [Bacteroidales bacterium]|nr:nucleotidyl transferase AbiEii/AbiGii toxin family protein [Bacteroidales bacterium]MCF8339000.1 nucleotidyl transferase AbiEii/AbiGii toxin family protein [Bacteroidales bacterium]
MLDINKHKFFLVTLLKDIYADTELASFLGFKGGTAHMLFYGLPRFSVDLDFNLLAPDKSEVVYKKIRKIILKYGKIRDEAEKYYGLLLVLDYGEQERNLKIEISNRKFPDRYETKHFLGIAIKVMVKPDMFAHKLCALLDRNMVANRDVFDVYYFLNQKTPINKMIVEERMDMPFEKYLDKCITRIEKIPPKRLLNGIGELVDAKMKIFVRQEMKAETIKLLKIYREFPLFE